MTITRNQPPSNWKSEGKYELPENGDEPYPYRAFGTGLKFSVFISLKMNQSDMDDLCGGGMQGFRIIFHASNENPNAIRQFFYLPPETASVFRIEPKMITTSDAALKHGPDERRCFLSSERKLSWFKPYTQRNCETECLSNFTANQCGCVPFYMARKTFDFSHSSWTWHEIPHFNHFILKVDSQLQFVVPIKCRAIVQLPLNCMN